MRSDLFPYLTFLCLDILILPLWWIPLVKALNLDMSRITFPMRNNHAHKLSGKVFIVVNSTIGGGQTPLRWKFLVENYPTTFPWTKGYCLQNFIAFGRIVSKCINNKHTHKLSSLYILISFYFACDSSNILVFFSDGVIIKSRKSNRKPKWSINGDWYVYSKWTRVFNHRFDYKCQKNNIIPRKCS
jgi:hypothetical protein